MYIGMLLVFCLHICFFPRILSEGSCFPSTPPSSLHFGSDCHDSHTTRQSQHTITTRDSQNTRLSLHDVTAIDCQNTKATPHDSPNTRIKARDSHDTRQSQHTAVSTHDRHNTQHTTHNTQHTHTHTHTHIAGGNERGSSSARGTHASGQPLPAPKPRGSRV